MYVTFKLANQSMKVYLSSTFRNKSNVIQCAVWVIDKQEEYNEIRRKKMSKKTKMTLSHTAFNLEMNTCRLKCGGNKI